MKTFSIIIVLIFSNLSLSIAQSLCSLNGTTEERHNKYGADVGFLTSSTFNLYHPDNDPNEYNLGIALHFVADNNLNITITESKLNTFLSELEDGFDPAKIFFTIVDSDTIVDSNGDYDNVNREKANDLSSQFNLKNAINIFFVKQVSEGVGFTSFSEKVLNWYNYFLDEECKITSQFIFIDEEAYDTTLPHEMGHFFDLFHTYSANNFLGQDDPADQYKTGDLCPDTEPAKFEHHRCSALLAIDREKAKNLMYNKTDCRSKFTANQISRMRYTLEVNRPYLKNRQWIELTNKISGNNAGGKLKAVQGVEESELNSGKIVGLKQGQVALLSTLDERFINWNSSTLDYKHHDWKGIVSDYSLSKNVEPENFSDYWTNYYNINSATLTTLLTSNNNTTDGEIEFHDPWYVSDENNTQPDDFLPFEVPYTASGKYNETEKGVFLNQEPHPTDPNIPFYQVRAKVDQSIIVHESEDIPFYFQYWSTNANADITQPDNTEIDSETGIDYYQSPLVFTGIIAGKD